MNISFRGRRLRASSYLALLTFFAGVVLSAFGAHFLHQTIQQEARAEFDRMAVRTELEIAHRFEKVVYALRGAGGLYAASKSVERAEFREYVMARDMEKEFPGVRGFGFVSRVNREDLEQFVAAERADGAPEFAIRQLADKGQADLFVIKLLEPAANNQGALGLDLGSESLRRAGIQQAISTGADTVTGAITLVQDNKKTPGVLLYHPIYRPHLPLGTPLERRAALAGVLYAPIVMAEILKGIPDVLSGRLDFEIVDAPINSPEGPLMYDADGHVSKLPPGAGHGTGRRYSLRKPLDLPGRSVTLSMNSTSTFDAAIHTLPAWLLLLGGTLISALLSALLFQQASARRRAETLARGMTADLQSALRDNEALLSTLNLHAIVSIADREGDIIEVNDAFCKISGYGREELLGKNHRIVNSNLHDQEFWKEMWNVISSGFPWRGQVCNRAKDGSHYWVDTFVAPFIGRDGRIEKYVSIRIDITENKRNEQALQEAKEQAQAASLSKSQFLANMSHEIRTPMNAILGMLTLLRKTELTPRQADYAAKSDGAARALLGLLNEILDFSKIEAGKMVLDPQPFALDQLLRDLSVILSANVGDKPVEVIFDIDPAVPRELIGDAMRLQQVLINLGGNAIKFTAEGEVVLAVKVLGHTQDTVTLQWSVQDTGIGIAPENQARIFSGFTQAESSTARRFGGTGLGVAISQRFVALMGGHLELQSELGKGSRFYFSITLPVVAQATATSALQQDMQVAAGLEPGQRLQGLRLLLAEDNPNNQQVARELLQDEGADVQVVNHGREAVDALAAAPTGYDMVLMDLQMPVMDGLAATRAIRQELGLLKLPIIAMTANAMASDRQACLDAGMNDHVGKPFDLNKLVQVLRRWAGWSDASALPDPHRLDIRGDILTAAQAAQVDLQTAIQRLGGKQDIYRRMLATFVHDLRSMPVQLRQYAETGSTQETQRLLHTLKGLAATLGAQVLSKEAAVAEKAVDIAHALHAIQDAQSPLEHLLAVMELDGAPGASAPTDAVIDKVALRHTLENLAQLLAESNLEAMNTMAEMELAYADALGAQLEPLRAAMSDMDFERALRLCQELMQI